ncbi:hypothetical protein [Leptolyngbya sp. 7M]|uniref:hypothetical protein n=1 Tax=Leptolyngbya sp. 7M TaxID=2812896 RepID=UPI001B8C3B2B|nr:hypothetical protein [Leptolyngbya sp. 7M]QYO67259.1 hypothetical protein JVX88_10895 [Leptolyngbya sp. 7M]
MMMLTNFSQLRKDFSAADPNLIFLRIFFVVSFLLFAGFLVSCENAENSYRFNSVSTYYTLDSRLSEPFGIAVHDGHIYFTDGHTGELVHFRPGDANTRGVNGLDTPSGIVVRKDGAILISETGTNTIKMISDDGREMFTFAGIHNERGFADGDSRSALFNGPTGLALADDGKLFVADTYNDRIRVIENGMVRTLAGSTKGFADGFGSAAMFDTPLGIATWGDKVLVADSGNRRIRVVEPDGTVWTLAGDGSEELRDGYPAFASLVSPTAVAADKRGVIFIADGHTIRAIGLRSFPYLETLAGGERGFSDSQTSQSKFNRPSGLAILGRTLLIADSDNGVIRSLHDGKSGMKISGISKPDLGPMKADEFRGLQPGRWPYDPPNKVREIAGTLGEIRGEIKDDNSQAWFHNGLDIPGSYGESATFIRDEKVLDPNAVANFGTLRELLRMPTIGYVHINLGRDIANNKYADPRFQFFNDANGKLAGVRIARGEKFKAGEKIGTLNAMNHVHLIAGRPGNEMNALDALDLPGISDSIPPVIESVSLFDENWKPLETKNAEGRIIIKERARVVVSAYDRKDGNAERRRLAPYRIGYHLARPENIGASDGVSPKFWAISFDMMPPQFGVRYAYAVGSRSGATGITVFNFIVTNRINGNDVREGFLESGEYPAGNYILRAFAADKFGNIASKDIQIEVVK